MPPTTSQRPNGASVVPGVAPVDAFTMPGSESTVRGVVGAGVGAGVVRVATPLWANSVRAIASAPCVRGSDGAELRIASAPSASSSSSALLKRALGSHESRRSTSAASGPGQSGAADDSGRGASDILELISAASVEAS